MARSRNIKPGFFKNPEIAELCFQDRLLFIGLWTLADRDGYLEDRPKRIKMELFPADNVDVESGLVALESLGFITRYSVGESRFMHVCKFLEHQHPHHLEKPSTIPKPETNPGQVSDKTQCNPSDSLIPDSLNPIKAPAKIGGAPLIEFKTFTANCKAAGEKLISDYKAVWDYAEKTGIPTDWIALAWRTFARTHADSGKKYKDWRIVFLKAIRGNWMKLWYFDAAGNCLMSSNGFAEQKFVAADQEAA